MSTEFTELKNLIANWAKDRTEPFLTADVYQNIEEAEDLKQASDTIRKLWKEGALLRKKVDGFRFAYALPAYAPADFEAAPQQKTESEQSPKPAKEATLQTKVPAPEQPESISKNTKEKTTVPRKSAPPAAKLPAMPAIDLQAQNRQSESIRSEGFSIRLETPGGIVITISTGA